MQAQRTTILIGCPIHTSQLEHKTASAIHFPSKRTDLDILKIFSTSSLLATNFNRIWSTALNYNAERPQEKHIKWFFLLHGDIVPEPNWVDKLIALAEKHETDLLSVVVPFKDQSGLTSTALGSPDPFNIVSRLTMHQVMELPPTFGAADVHKYFSLHDGIVSQAQAELTDYPLLVNSGCIIVNMQMPYARSLYFTINDHIRTDKQGRLYPVTDPEDWFFSRLIQSHGGKVMATREVEVAHVGQRNYNNNQVWGATWDDHYTNQLTNNPMNGTIWSLDEAKTLHVHSPGLAQWLCANLSAQQPVYDFGCGTGRYLKALEDNGFTEVMGYEGTPGIENIAVTDAVEQHDITGMHTIDKSLIDPGQVLCIEVLEHIRPEDESNVLDTLTNFCKSTLVLSWAIEGQNGHGHINCRNADYVVPTVEARGFKIDFVRTMQARAAAACMPTLSFFNQSLYVFNRV